VGILFVVEGANKTRINTKFVCKECGAVYGRFYGERPKCKTCQGFGRDPKDDPIGSFAFDAPRNEASLILHDILNYGHEEQPTDAGQLNPSDVLIRLSLADFHIESLVRPLFPMRYTDTDRVIEIPREEVLQAYVEKLTTLAEKALELDEDIIYRTR
jgi:hypothetical protein